MGLSLWHLCIDNQGNLHRLPSDFIDGKKTSIKDQTVKAIELSMNLENRRPVKVNRDVYYKLKFDKDGVLDRDFYEEAAKVLLLFLEYGKLSLFNKDSVEPMNQFVTIKKKYDEKYRWVPTKKELKLINQYLNKKGLPLNNLLKWDQ